jgi:hypothetical protein
MVGRELPSEAEPIMNYEDLRAQTRQQPFRPFRLYLTTGEAFEVRRQDGHVLSRNYVVIGLPGISGGTDYDRTTMIDLLHIVRVEPLTLPGPPQGNGQSG